MLNVGNGTAFFWTEGGFTDGAGVKKESYLSYDAKSVPLTDGKPLHNTENLGLLSKI